MSDEQGNWVGQIDLDQKKDAQSLRCPKGSVKIAIITKPTTQANWGLRPSICQDLLPAVMNPITCTSYSISWILLIAADRFAIVTRVVSNANYLSTRRDNLPQPTRAPGRSYFFSWDQMSCSRCSFGNAKALEAPCCE